MSSYSAQVLPLLFASLNAPVEDVQIKCLYALNCFSDQLGDDIIPYLDPMMRQLSHMLQTGNQQIREHTVLAIAAAAVAAGKVRWCTKALASYFCGPAGMIVCDVWELCHGTA